MKKGDPNFLYKKQWLDFFVVGKLYKRILSNNNTSALLFLGWLEEGEEDKHGPNYDSNRLYMIFLRPKGFVKPWISLPMSPVRSCWKKVG